MIKVLLISTTIVPPIDNANKATVVNMVSSLKNIFFYILTSKNHDNTFLKDMKNISLDPVYDEKKHHMALSQKIRLAKRLLCNKDTDIDIYHCLLEPTKFSLQFLKLILTLRPTKSIITLLNKIENPALLKKLCFFDKIVVSSDYMEKILTGMGIHNVVRIYPSVDLNKFKSIKKKETFWRKKLNLERNPVVLYAGNYNTLHGIYDIEKALPRIFETIPNVKFIFACRSYFKHQFTARNKFVERLKRTHYFNSVFFLESLDSMKDLIITTDILLFPMREVTKKSDIPIILLEALALETPIIITNIPPLNEIMKEEAGIFVPVGSPKSIADAVIQLLSDSKLREKMGRQGRMVVEKFFSSDAQARQYFEIYSEIG